MVSEIQHCHGHVSTCSMPGLSAPCSSGVAGALCSLANPLHLVFKLQVCKVFSLVDDLDHKILGYEVIQKKQVGIERE